MNDLELVKHLREVSAQLRKFAGQAMEASDFERPVREEKEIMKQASINLDPVQVRNFMLFYGKPV